MQPYYIQIGAEIDLHTYWSTIKKQLEKQDIYNEHDITRYNGHIILNNFSNFCNDMFYDYVELHDKYSHVDGRSKFGTGINCIQYSSDGKKRKKAPDKCYKIGFKNNVIYWDYVAKLTYAIMDKTGKDKKSAADLAFTIIANGFRTYLDKFHDYNPYLYVFEAYLQQSLTQPMTLYLRVMPVVPCKVYHSDYAVNVPYVTIGHAIAKQYKMEYDRTKTITQFKHREMTHLTNSINNEANQSLNLYSHLMASKKARLVTPSLIEISNQEQASITNLLAEK